MLQNSNLRDLGQIGIHRIEYRIVIDNQKIYPQPSYPESRWADVARLAGEGRWDAKLEERTVRDFKESDPFWFVGCMRFDDLTVTPWRTLAHVPIESRSIGGLVG